MIEKGTWRRLLGEFVGTFLLVCAILFPGIALRDAGLGAFLFIMFTAGLGLAIVTWLFRDVSGAHVNPAVTFAAMLTRQVSILMGVLYWIAQLAGGVAAAYYARATFRLETGSASELANYGMAVPTAGYKDSQIMMAEAIGVFILVLVVLAVSQVKDKILAGLAIGAALLVAVIITAPVSGGAINPAREFGPMIVANALKKEYWLYYLLAPFIGSLVAVVVDTVLREPKQLDWVGKLVRRRA